MNITNGSCFGTQCFSNNDAYFPFNGSGTGRPVLESTTAPSFDGEAFFSQLTAYTDNVTTAALLGIDVYSPLAAGTAMTISGSLKFLYHRSRQPTQCIGYSGVRVIDFLVCQ